MAGRYEILRVLGAGGSAVVYAARDLTVGDEVALKILRAERLSETGIKRSRREAAMARGTASDRLVRVFDLEQTGDLVCLPMELVRGGSLRDLIAAEPLPIARVVALAIEIVEALEVLHANGIVHRDVKPANLLLTREGHVKLSDFGLAFRWSRDESALTAAGTPMGTIDYLSPEQATGDEVDPRSDLYSFGVVLFEMLAGSVPFSGDSAVSSIVARLREPAADVRALRRDTPPWLAAIVRRLLEKDRDLRYATATDVLRDLRASRATRSRRPLRLALLIAVPLAIALAATIAVIALRPPRVPRIVASSHWGIQALDDSGRVLWSRHDVGPNRYAVVRRGRQREIAAVLGPRDVTTGEGLRKLSFLDVDDGRVVGTADLPEGNGFFPTFSPRFGVANVTATDVDGDGYDEVVTSYIHELYWPSYSVLHDLRRGDSHIVFAASGHHLLAATVDLDGDGVKELLFSGINNRMGWHIGIAAVKVYLGEPQGFDLVASTPDAVYSLPGKRVLLWYALNPQGAVPYEDRVIADARTRTIRLQYVTRPPVELTFDGFPVSAVRTPPAERSRLRDGAYAHMREAVRLTTGGFANDGIAEARAAAELATRAGDRALFDWAERNRARALVAAGRFADAEDVFRAIAARTGTPADIDFEAARDFHLAGALPQAVAWYRQGTGRGAASGVGRLKWEFVEGIVLALGEMGRWTEADEEISRIAAAYANAFAHADWYHRYVEWRTTGAPSNDALVPPAHDLHHYWALEFALARGAAPAALLRELDVQAARASGSKALFASLRAELLARLGRNAEALAAARAAYAAASGERLTETATRAHFGLVASRFAAIARRNGAAAEAAAAVQEAERFRWQPAAAATIAPPAHALSRSALQ